MLVEVRGEIDAVERVRDIVVAADGGAAVRVADVASVTRGLAEPADTLAMADGRDAVLIAAHA